MIEKIEVIFDTDLHDKSCSMIDITRENIRNFIKGLKRKSFLSIVISYKASFKNFLLLGQELTYGR